MQLHSHVDNDHADRFGNERNGCEIIRLPFIHAVVEDVKDERDHDGGSDDKDHCNETAVRKKTRSVGCVDDAKLEYGPSGDEHELGRDRTAESKACDQEQNNVGSDAGGAYESI